jgi:hypothetical protein
VSHDSCLRCPVTIAAHVHVQACQPVLEEEEEEERGQVHVRASEQICARVSCPSVCEFV